MAKPDRTVGERATHADSRTRAARLVPLRSVIADVGHQNMETDEGLSEHAGRPSTPPPQLVLRFHQHIPSFTHIGTSLTTPLDSRSIYLYLAKRWITPSPLYSANTRG